MTLCSYGQSASWLVFYSPLGRSSTDASENRSECVNVLDSLKSVSNIVINGIDDCMLNIIDDIKVERIKR